MVPALPLDRPADRHPERPGGRRTGSTAQVRRGLPVHLAWTLSLLLTAGLLLVPGHALGAKVHHLTASFGSPGSGDGQLALGAHSGLAVDDATGNVYVADTGNHRVVEFDADGGFIRAFGADVGGAGVDVCSSGCVAGTSGSSPGALEAPTFLAIDESAGPSNAAVYVADASNHLVTRFAADGTLVSSWGVGGRLDGSSAPGGPFGEIGGIAVDSAGTLDVFRGREPEEPHLLFRFDQGGSFLEQVETPRGNEPGGLAVDPAGDLFKVNGDLSVEKLEGSGADVGQVTASFSTTGLAVDRAGGDLYVGTGSLIERYVFGPSGEVVGAGCTPAPFEGCPSTTTFGAGDLVAGAGLDVKSDTRTVFAADAAANQILVFAFVTVPTVLTEAANPLGAAGATLNGSVNPDEVPLSECLFEYDTAPYLHGEDPHGGTAACEAPDAAEVGAGDSPVPVHAAISGLQPGTTYHFRLRAANAEASNAAEEQEFTTLGPIVAAASVSEVTAVGARIGGQVNPRGEATGFFVEYVTDAEFDEGEYAQASSVPTPAQEVGSGTEFVKVARQLDGLAPDTLYHLRLVATNAGGITSRSSDLTFRTFVRAAAGLPDGRAYEMVSPVQKFGEVFVPAPGAGLGGSCINCLPGLSLPRMPMQSRPDGEAVAYEGQAFFTGLAAGPNEYLSHRGIGGWGLQGLSSPLFANGRGTEEGYLAFSADLSRSIVYQIGPPLSPDSPLDEEGESFANLYLRDESGSLQPLVTADLPNRSAGEFGADQFRILFAGANAGTTFSQALSHVVFEANDALTGPRPDAPAAIDGGAVEPPGETRPINLNLYESSGGALRLVNVAPGNTETAPGAVIGSGHLLTPNPLKEGAAVDHAISEDGSRIFWSDEETGQVFVRIDGEETREVLDHEGRFLTASADGSRVLLSDGCLYAVEAAACEADLNQDASGLEGILGASEDLARVYFVDRAALTGADEENADGEHAQAGELNLYAWEEGAPTRLIGILRPGDNQIGVAGEYGTWKASRSNRTAQVSPDGRYLAFMSRARLTGYDNGRRGAGVGCGDTAEGTPCFQVFEYDAATAGLTCASCNPSGQRPLGPSNLSLIQGFFPLPQPGNLSAEGGGRLFFESQDALTEGDSNGKVQDVYEWEPNGVGNCQRAGGCISLISGGDHPNDSMFLDSSAAGDDAFFVTRQRLLPRDRDDLLDLYDARAPHLPGEAVGFPESEAAPCGGESCTGPPSPAPIEPGIGSSSFVGPGNSRPPRRHRKSRHGKKKHKMQRGHRRRSQRSGRGGPR